MIWIAKTSANLGTPDARAAAAELIKKIIKKSNSDQAFNEKVKQALPALNSLGATIEAELNHFDQAEEMIDRFASHATPAIAHTSQAAASHGAKAATAAEIGNPDF